MRLNIFRCWSARINLLILGSVLCLWSSMAFGTDLPAAVQRLQKIAGTVEKYEKIDAQLNYRIRGEIRFATTGKREPASTKPEQFALTVQGNRQRYEHDWHLPNESIHCIELIDGLKYYRATGKRVLVFPLKPEQQKVRREFGSLSTIRQPIYEGQGMSLAQRLRWWVEQLQAAETAHLWSSGKRSFTLVEDAESVIIRDQPGEGQTGGTFELHLDPQHCYRATKWRIDDGSDHDKWHYICEIEPQYCSRAANPSLIVGGTIFVSESGTVVAGTQRDGTIKSHTDAEQVEFGDFELPANFFDSASLPPIPKRKGVAWYP